MHPTSQRILAQICSPTGLRAPQSAAPAARQQPFTIAQILRPADVGVLIVERVAAAEAPQAVAPPAV